MGHTKNEIGVARRWIQRIGSSVASKAGSQLSDASLVGKFEQIEDPAARLIETGAAFGLAGPGEMPATGGEALPGVVVKQKRGRNLVEIVATLGGASGFAQALDRRQSRAQ